MNIDAIRPDGPTIAIEHQATGETPVNVTPEGVRPGTVPFKPEDFNRPITIIDLIRAMTADELAVFLSNTDGDFPPTCESVPVRKLEDYWLEWLQADAEP